MCNPTDIQHKIHKRTGAGDMIAKFLVETLQGQHTDAKFNHRLDAAKHLMKYGFSEANPVRPELVEGPVEGHEATALSTRHSRAGGNPEAQGDDETPVQSPLSPGERARVRGTEIATPISHLDILNYEIAHLIRHETAEGHTLVEFLIHTMTGRDRPFTPKKFCIKPADRMAAARELLRRGFGDLGSRRRQSDTTDEANAYDTLHTDLAKRMREYSERGTDTVRFLLEVMSDPNPEEEYTIHHRMSAAQELLRRGWDTNYDNIKPKHLQDYWRDKESPASLHRPEKDPRRSLNLHRRLRQLRRHRLRSHSQRDDGRRRPRRQLKASSFPRDRPIFLPFLRKQESRRPPSRLKVSSFPRRRESRGAGRGAQ